MRVFVALDVPSDVESQLVVQQFLMPIPRKVDRSQFHLTLCFMDEMRDAELEALHEGLMALRMAPFEVALAGSGFLARQNRMPFGRLPRHPSLWRACRPR